MNYRLIGKVLGLVLLIEAAFMLLPMIVAFLTNEKDWKYFIITLVCTAVAGIVLFNVKVKRKTMYARDGLLIVGLTWVIMSLIGAVPFYISGLIPDFINAVFESVSGFTTSGVSIVPDVESATHAMLFWRSLTHWIGGMGILVFMLAISPLIGGSSIHLMKSEAPGPTTEKMTPKISQTAKWLYAMYFALTIAEIIALTIAGMTVFQSTLISFGTLATGGFSYMNSSLAEFTYAQQVIVEVFMFLAGVNFSLYFLVLTGKLKKVFKDLELRWYSIILFVSMVIISINVWVVHDQFETLGEAIHQTVFAVLAAMTSTGFAAWNYNLWPVLSQTILLILMFVGGCAGSTGGGIKVSRFVLLFKGVVKNMRVTFNPKEVSVVRYNGKTVPSGVIRSVAMYFGTMIFILIFSMIIVSTEPGMDIATALSSVATTLNNNGIELKNAAVAGFGNYSWYSRIVFIIDMLIGRLEIFPIMAVFIYMFKPVGKAVKAAKRKRAAD